MLPDRSGGRRSRVWIAVWGRGRALGVAWVSPLFAETWAGIVQITCGVCAIIPRNRALGSGGRKQALVEGRAPGGFIAWRRRVFADFQLYLDRTRNSDRDRRDLYIRGRAGRSAADRAVRPSSKAQRQ